MEDRRAEDEDASPRKFHARDFRFVETREEIVIIFGAGRPSPSTGAGFIIDTASQIVLNPAAAKRFSLLLKEIVSRHESAYGVIEPPSAPAGASGPVPRRKIIAPVRDGTGNNERLRRLVEDLGADYGLEYSFKIFPGVILDDRSLIAMHRRAIPGNAPEKLLDLCRQLNMPRHFQQRYLENLSDTNIVLFGFEGNEASGTFKAYLEFGSMFGTVVHETSGAPVSFLMHLGFKWDAEDNRRATMARYTCYPTFSTPEILDRIEKRFYAREGGATYEIVRSIVERADREEKKEHFLYMEVAEENNPRQSYDVNMYLADLKLKDMYSWLREACRIYGIDQEAFHRVYEPMKEKRFGHVSGGFDRSGRAFLTFYYGLAGVTPETGFGVDSG